MPRPPALPFCPSSVLGDNPLAGSRLERRVCAGHLSSPSTTECRRHDPPLCCEPSSIVPIFCPAWRCPPCAAAHHCAPSVAATLHLGMTERHAPAIRVLPARRRVYAADAGKVGGGVCAQRAWRSVLVFVQVRIARIGGQYSKPRSSPTEVGCSLPRAHTCTGTGPTPRSSPTEVGGSLPSRHCTPSSTRE